VLKSFRITTVKERQLLTELQK